MKFDDVYKDYGGLLMQFGEFEGGPWICWVESDGGNRWYVLNNAKITVLF